ncbi:hypothetical protein, partial [Salmonella enterica]|uniref:hypothetical protein n=1 Tax=Salmonella enterica TaxID=28901 RepID=UPI001C56FC5A
MATVSDYMVLHGSPFKLGFGGDTVKRLPFDLPGDFVAGTKYAKPILAFLVQPSSGHVVLDVYVNPPLPSIPSGHPGPIDALTGENRTFG